MFFLQDLSTKRKVELEFSSSRMFGSSIRCMRWHVNTTIQSYEV